MFLTPNAAYEDIDPSTTTNEVGLRILMSSIFTNDGTLAKSRETTTAAWTVTLTFETSTSVSDGSYSFLQIAGTDGNIQDALPVGGGET